MRVTVVTLVSTIEAANGQPPYIDDEGQDLFSHEGIDEAKNRLLKRIRKARDQDQLFSLSDHLEVIFRWSDWAGPDEVKSYLCQQIESDEGLLRVLVAFISEIRSAGGGEGTTVSRYVRRSYLEQFLDLEELTARVQQVTQSPPHDPTDDERLALQSFLEPPAGARFF